MGTKISKKRKIFNAFLVVILVCIVFLSPYYTTGLAYSLEYRKDRNKNGINSLEILEKNYEFTKTMNSNDISELLSVNNTEKLLIVGVNDFTGGFVIDAKCIFSTKNSPLNCWHFFLKENGKIEPISLETYQKLSDQNITKVVIKRKSRRFQDF